MSGPRLAGCLIDHHLCITVIGADPAYKLREGGRLCDIVPTLIELMGLEKPKEMTGESLLVK